MVNKHSFIKSRDVRNNCCIVWYVKLVKGKLSQYTINLKNARFVSTVCNVLFTRTVGEVTNTIRHPWWRQNNGWHYICHKHYCYCDTVMILLRLLNVINYKTCEPLP